MPSKATTAAINKVFMATPRVRLDGKQIAHLDPASDRNRNKASIAAVLPSGQSGGCGVTVHDSGTIRDKTAILSHGCRVLAQIFPDRWG
jgi:hypothetical protein